MQLRLCAVLAGLIAAVLLVATPAHAGRQTTRDAAHDVYRIPAGGTPGLQRANSKHDIVRA